MAEAILNGNGAASSNGHAAAPNHNSSQQQPPPPAFPPGMERLIANELSFRREFFNRLMDPRRNLEDECGYPPLDANINVELFRQLYDREAVPARVIQVMPKESWQAQPLVYEDDSGEISTAFEQAWDDLGRQITPGGGASWHQDEAGSPIWEHLVRADTLSRIGHFGLILLGIDDGKGLETPLEGAVQVSNRRAVPVLNAAGRQIGVRMERLPADQSSTHSSPLPIPDGFLTQDQQDRLLDDRAWDKRVWNLRKRDFEVQAGLPLSNQEKQVVANWERERQLVLNQARDEAEGNRESIENALDDALGTPLENADHARRDHPAVENFDAPTGRAKDKDGRDLFAGDGSSLLSGTDAQYHGMIGGPSQFPGEQDKAAKKEKKLLFLRAFDESLVQVVRYEWNIRNPRFGMPVMYRVTLHDPREQHTGVGLPLATVFVHWSRVIHLADSSANAGSSEIFAPPVMRPVLNRLLDLRKLYGAAAEGYWKSCFNGLSYETLPALGGDVSIDIPALKSMHEAYDNGLQRALFTSGMTVKTLAPSVVDPTSQIAVQLEAICIQLGIPIRVFKGSERGELASSQDDASWNDRLNQRRLYYNTPRIIVPFIDRLIQVGVLPEPEGYTVEWPDLDSLSDSDKATIANTKTMALSAYVQGGVEALIPPIDFLSKIIGFDEEEAQQILDDAEKATEKQQQEQDDLADEHGMVPDIEGWQHPEELGPPGGPQQPPQAGQPAPPAAGAPEQEEPAPAFGVPAANAAEAPQPALAGKQAAEEHQHVSSLLAGKGDGSSAGGGTDLGDGRVGDAAVHKPASAAVAKMLEGSPDAQRTAKAIAALHDGAVKLAKASLTSLVEKHGKETSSDILASLDASHPDALAGIPSVIGDTPESRSLLAAIPLLAIAEAAKEQGLLEGGSVLEKSLARAGSWIHAIKDAAKGAPEDEEGSADGDQDEDKQAGETADKPDEAEDGGEDEEQPAKSKLLAGQGKGKLVGNEKDGWAVVNSAGKAMAGPGWAAVGRGQFVLIGDDGRVVTR